ncbi:MAG: hypothetical protein M9949_04580 [Candidatus Kapabacteria bacterium]|nr:hypothetical protein [Candidatus Kapabacteria bacterium]
MSDQNKEKLTLDEPVFFEANGAKYTYDYKLLKIKNAEPALAIVQFHIDQAENPPDEVKAVTRGEGYQWQTHVMKYLLFKLIDEVPTFDISKINETFDNLQETNLASQDENLSGSFRLMEVCINDFLFKLGKQSLISKLRSTGVSKTKIAMISTLLANSAKA